MAVMRVRNRMTRPSLYVQEELLLEAGSMCVAIEKESSGKIKNFLHVFVQKGILLCVCVYESDRVKWDSQQKL